MANIIIKKRISLAHLGKDYEEGYLVFSSIPIAEIETLWDELQNIQDDNKKSLEFIIKMLKGHFVEGKFPNEGSLEDIDKEDIGKFDTDSVVHFFEVLTGRSGDPLAPAS